MIAAAIGGILYVNLQTRYIHIRAGKSVPSSEIVFRGWPLAIEKYTASIAKDPELDPKHAPDTAENPRDGFRAEVVHGAADADVDNSNEYFRIYDRRGIGIFTLKLESYSFSVPNLLMDIGIWIAMILGSAAVCEYFARRVSK